MDEDLAAKEAQDLYDVRLCVCVCALLEDYIIVGWRKKMGDG